MPLLAAMFSALGVMGGWFVGVGLLGGSAGLALRAHDPAIRIAGNLFPLTYFVPISRGIITKGIGLEYMWEQVAAMFIYIVVIMVFASRAFRQGLD